MPANARMAPADHPPNVLYAIVHDCGWLTELTIHSGSKHCRPFSSWKWGTPGDALFYEDYFEASRIARETDGTVLTVVRRSDDR